ncbi:Hemopexin-like repeat protein [Trinorchestia longiramus]|nr:Hemopexin-like repeat protein [Trinorchestia longiramus]
MPQAVADTAHTWHMEEIDQKSAYGDQNRNVQRNVFERVGTEYAPDTFSGDGADSSVPSMSQRLEEYRATEPRSSLHDYINPNYTMRDFMADNNIYVSSTTNKPGNSSWQDVPGLDSDNLKWHEKSGKFPASQSSNFTLEKQIVRNENYAIKFMQQFGYVPQSDSTSGFIFTSESLKESIKTVQKFGDLPQTGELDDVTLQLMKSPRCGVPDVSPPPREGGPKGGLTTIAKQGIVLTIPDEEDGGSRRRPKRYVLGGGGWNKRTITYHVENHSSKLHSIGIVQRELHKAFETWSSYARLNFTHVPDRDADIIIYFAEYDHYDGYPFDGQGGTLAHAYYPYEFGHYGGDIHFDESEKWAINPKDEFSGLDFFTVAVHEIGHSLGLAHSYVRSSIMFPYYKGNSEHFALDHDDVMGMYELYIQRHLPGDDKYFNEHYGDATSSTSKSTTTTTPRPPTTTTTPVYPDADGGTQNDAGSEGDDYAGETESENEEDVRRKQREEEERRRREEEERRREEEQKWYEEEAKRAEEEARKREEDRRAYEEEMRKKEEEAWRQYQEELTKREEERRKSDEKWRREEEERVRQEEEKRRRAYEEELRRYEEEIMRRKKEDDQREKMASEASDAASTDGWLEVEVAEAVNAPNICNGSFDAVAKIRNELFMFKGEYMWRFESRGLLRAGYPAPIRALFPGLPSWSQRIDAAYQRQNDSVVVFFVGKHFFELGGHHKKSSPSRPLADLGLPDYVTQLDAAFFWPKNGKVYFFRHDEYWRFDEAVGRMDNGYPQPMERWHGVPSYLDAAYTWDAAVSYFFKGNSFWEYDNMNIKPVEGYPRSIKDYWFNHC